MCYLFITVFHCISMYRNDPKFSVWSGSTPSTLVLKLQYNRLVWIPALQDEESKQILSQNNRQHLISISILKNLCPGQSTICTHWLKQTRVWTFSSRLQLEEKCKHLLSKIVMSCNITWTVTGHFGPGHFSPRHQSESGLSNSDTCLSVYSVNSF